MQIAPLSKKKLTLKAFDAMENTILKALMQADRGPFRFSVSSQDVVDKLDDCLLDIRIDRDNYIEDMKL